MATNIRAELSPKNKYWINKHRYYELKHFCLQYPLWKKIYLVLDDMYIPSSEIKIAISDTNTHSDHTAKRAVAKAYYASKIKMIERMATQADSELSNYILKAVTEELSYSYLKTKMSIPCSRDTYYDRYRKFFWLLSKERQ